MPGGTRVRIADGFLVATVIAWLVWVSSMPLWTGRAASPASPYVTAPLLLLAGILAGRVLGSLPRRWRVAELVFTACLIVLVTSDLYANALGALGVQLVALTGLMLHTGLSGGCGGRRAAHLMAVGVGILVIGVLLASGSDAAALLVLPVAIITALALGLRNGPPRLLVGVVATALLAVAATAVGWLATLAVWPAQIRTLRSLSQVRHRLWRDALELWRQHPVTGAGPGSFRDHSALAASDPDLERVHSSFLQVGSELGLVGCLLFALLLVAGLAVAGQADRAVALVGMTAWTALGVHSVIDHLYEFPVVTLTAAVVLGWTDPASRHRRSSRRSGGSQAS